MIFGPERLTEERTMTEFISNFNVVGVPSHFIENVMPKANGAFVKVYLYVLDLAAKGASADEAEIAEALELLESDVVKAFEYLEENGCIERGSGYIAAGAGAFGGGHGETPGGAERGHNDDAGEPGKVPAESVKNIMEGNQMLADLCQLAQQTLGKTLSDRDIETLYWMYENLGFSPEVILMILEYCVSKDKRNMNYIEKVAIGWHENGITTIDAAQKYMTDMREKNSYFGNIRRLFGIDGRPLSKTEETYLKNWRDNCNMSEDMVALAYEYCIINTGRLSFPYINTIIENWFEKNIFSVPDAEKEHEEHKSAARPEKDGYEVYKDRDGFDYGSIDDIMRKKYDGS